MDASDLVIDTSLIIEHLRKQNKHQSTLFKIFPHYSLYVPTIVEFELFSGANNSQKQKEIREILKQCNSLPFTSDVAQQAGFLFQTLRQSNQLVEIRDILIAATAVTNNLPLMTLNKKHFQRIHGLRLISPPA